MILNRLLAAVQRMQLLGHGHKEVKVFVQGKWYVVRDIAAYEDNIVIAVKE